MSKRDNLGRIKGRCSCKLQNDKLDGESEVHSMVSQTAAVNKKIDEYALKKSPKSKNICMACVQKIKNGDFTMPLNNQDDEYVDMSSKDILKEMIL